MAIFANVFDEETYVHIDDNDLPCLRLEDEEARIDILCSKEVLYRIHAVLDVYLNVSKNSQTKSKVTSYLQEAKQDVQED